MALSKADKRIFQAAFVNPRAHRGFFDHEATHDRERRFLPISQRITLKEPYATFFRELKALREAMGRGDVTSEEALTKALKLEENAGLKGVIIRDADDADNAKTAKVFLDQMENEIEALGFRPDYRSAYGTRDYSDAEAELRGEIRRFFMPIANGLQLKPIEPVRLDADVVVNGVLAGMANGFLGPEPRHEAERPAVTRARGWLGTFARQNPDFLTAVEAFVRAAAEHGRVDANLIVDFSEKPKAEPAEALVMKGAGGS